MASSSTAVTSGELARKVKQYKQLYGALRVISLLMFILLIAYILLIKFSPQNAYEPLSENIRTGKVMAVDSSGRIIAFPIYNDKDSTLAFLMSADSGRTFIQPGGWKKNTVPGSDDYNSYVDSILAIGISSDSCIVAVGTYSVYLKASLADSFTRIYATKFPGMTGSLQGFCFVPQTDSVYVYDSFGDVLCMSWRHYDTAAIAQIKDAGYVKDMRVSNNRIFVLENEGFFSVDERGKGVIILNHLPDKKIYPVAQYNNKSDKESEPEKLDDAPDTSRMEADTAIYDQKYINKKPRKSKL